MKKLLEVRRGIQPHWVGDGFPVRSLFSYQEGNAFDPFLLLDYAGPHVFAPAEAPRGVHAHPHRGFETVTIVYQGELEHRDSAGTRGSIGPGDVQWMTAASGLVHEEFHSERFARQGGTLEMVQLWVNLPAKEKASAPGYQEIRDARIPRVLLPNASGDARVIAGALHGVRGPARTFTPINVWDLQLRSGGATELRIPDGHTTVLVVRAGEVRANDAAVRAVELASFDRRGEALNLYAESDSRVLVLTGEPLGEPVVGQGPFVMNTRQEIRRAVEDYQAGRMGRLEHLT